MTLYEVNYALNLIVQLMLGVFLFNNLCKSKHGFVVTLGCYYLPFLIIQILSLHYTKLPQSVYSASKMLLTFIILMTFYEASIKRALSVLGLFTALQLVCEFPSIGIVKLLGYNIFSNYSSVNGSVYITVGRIYIINLFLVMILAAVYIYSRKHDNDTRRLTDLLMISNHNLKRLKMRWLSIRSRTRTFYHMHYSLRLQLTSSNTEKHRKPESMQHLPILRIKHIRCNKSDIG